MPHDKNGAVLVVGDVVAVECVVKSVTAEDGYCNVSLETTQPMFPSEDKSSITLNAKQVVKASA